MEPWMQQANQMKKHHTEDCLDANDDTSPLKGRCICPDAELLEACKYAFAHLKPSGDIRKDYSGHLAMAALSKAIAHAEEK